MLIKSHRDFWSGLLFFVAGVAFGARASLQQVGSATQPGPGYVPLVLSVALALVGAAVLFRALTIETERGHRIERPAWRPLLAIVGAAAVFAAVAGHAGPVAAVAPAALMATRATRFGGWRAGWAVSLATAMVLTALTWAGAACLAWPPA